MKVKSKRKMAGILAAVLIALVLLAFDCINGDPISERWAMHRAIQFAEKLYPDQTFTAENAGSMRGFCYTVSVQSQQSRDTRFYVETSFWLFTSDTPTVDHTQYVDARLNTAWRMNEEARADLAPALADSAGKITRLEMSIAPIIRIPSTMVKAVSTDSRVLYSPTFTPLAREKLSSKVMAKSLW